MSETRIGNGRASDRRDTRLAPRRAQLLSGILRLATQQNSEAELTVFTREAQPDKWAHTHARGVHCGRPPALNDYQREEAARRLAEGESVRSVARLLGVSHVTVAKLRFA